MFSGLKWRDPNFTEVINFLNNPNDTVKANAAAYLQHLCYMDDPNKQKCRALGGIPPLVKLLNHESPSVYRNAAGALRYWRVISRTNFFGLQTKNVMTAHGSVDFFAETYHMEGKMMRTRELSKMPAEFQCWWTYCENLPIQKLKN